MPYEDPNGEFGWSDDEVLISTPLRNYTVRNYEQFFRDLNFTDGYEWNWLFKCTRNCNFTVLTSKFLHLLHYKQIFFQTTSNTCEYVLYITLLVTVNYCMCENSVYENTLYKFTYCSYRTVRMVQYDWYLLILYEYRL